MREPIWLPENFFYVAHDAQIAEHGGISGIRDINLLKSAINKPINRYHYEDPRPTICELAAAYAFGIAKNHAFIDGNKRTALATMGVFLELNGYSIQASKEELFYIIELLATSDASEKELARWLEINTAETDI